MRAISAFVISSCCAEHVLEFLRVLVRSFSAMGKGLEQVQEQIASMVRCACDVPALCCTLLCYFLL